MRLNVGLHVDRSVHVLLALVFLLAVLVVLASGGVALAVSYSSEEVAFADLINKYRVSNGLAPLLISDTLSEAGDRHSSDMGKYSFFDHFTKASDWFKVGASPVDRMAATGYSYSCNKGENIAAGYSTAEAVFQGWKNSPGHNANMLNSDFKVLGVSLVVVSGSPYTSYWTTDFGAYVDPTAHSLGSVTPTTVAPTTTTTVAPTTTTAPPTTTTTAAVPALPVSTSTTTTSLGSSIGSSFVDVDSDTLYAASIRAMADEEVVTGYLDGTFRPEQPVTRQQFAKMIMLALHSDVPVPTTITFRDVATRLDGVDPLYPLAYVEACAAAGITVGTAPGIFNPAGTMTRAQLITMVARAAKLPAVPADVTAPFGDFSSQHYPWALRAYAAGLLDGFVDMGRHFDFWGPATRAEVCLLLAQLHD